MESALDEANSGNRAIYLGPISGPAHTLTVDGSLQFGDGDDDPMTPDFSLSLANLEVSGTMRLLGDNSADDVLGGVTGNVTVLSGGELILTEGAYNLANLTLNPGSTLELNPSSNVNRLDLSASPSFTVPSGVTLEHGASGTPDFVELDITVGDGGTLVTGELQKRRGRLRGTLTLLDGSLLSLSVRFQVAEGGGYVIDSNDPTDAIVFGAAATDSLITIEGGSRGRVDASSATVIQSDNFTQLGNVTLRYETLSDDRWFKLGFDPLNDGDDFANYVPVSNSFLAGNALTQFAPIPADPMEVDGAGMFVMGPEMADVFVTSTPTELTTAGTVVFWEVPANGEARRDVVNPANNQGQLGNVLLQSGGTFEFLAGGTAVREHDDRRHRRGRRWRRVHRG